MTCTQMHAAALEVCEELLAAISQGDRWLLMYLPQAVS